MPDLQRTPEVLTRTAAFEPATFNQDNRTVEMIWSTGAAVLRKDFWTGKTYHEELDLNGADLSRLNAGAPLLNTHASRDLADVIGVVERAWISNGEGRAKVRFSEREEVAPIVADVQSGILRNISVGYSVKKYEITEGDTPTYRAVDWQPMELSMVPIGADAGAQFRSHEGNIMPQTVTTPATPDPIAAERTRVADILALTTRHGIDPQSLIASGASVDQARAQILDTLATRDAEGTRPRLGFTTDFGTQGDIETRIERMTEALTARHGGPAPSEQARPYVRARLTDMARELLELRGIATTRLNAHELISRALATSDFPNLLTGTGNRQLRAAYESYPAGLRRAAKESSARDFRTLYRLALGEAPTLQKVNEHGEFTQGAMAELKESYAIATYGRIVALTRQAIINDDLGAFSDLQKRMGIAAAEFEAGQLATLLQSNAGAGPTLANDSTALFHANHGNLAGSGAAIADATLTAARLALRKMKGIDGVTPINAAPRYLVVPAALETTAQKYLAALQPAQTTNVNPFADGSLTLIVDVRLDAASATAWYLVADPALVDGLEFAYLEGAAGPQIESRAGFEVDGLEIKVRVDFGCAFLDHRGWYRNAGA